MTYRPIADNWILARPKVKYYGAFPNGFLERAMVLLGANENDRVLHLCGGRVKDYPNKRLVKNAVTVDVDDSLNPDYHIDLNNGGDIDSLVELLLAEPVRAVLIDPPYTEEDHKHYATNGAKLPTANYLLRVGLRLVPPACKVGVLHYIWPQPPKTARSIAKVSVTPGFNNRDRSFSVYERIAT
jgi:hypothetical protein